MVGTKGASRSAVLARRIGRIELSWDYIKVQLLLWCSPLLLIA